MKKLRIFLICLIIPIKVSAADITQESEIKINNVSVDKIKDNNENSYITISKDKEIIISSTKDIYGIYIIYELKSQNGVIKSNNQTANIGENDFLHEYVNVDKLIGHTNNLTIKYEEDVKIGEIYILSEGQLPEYVEVWEPPHELADLLLFSTHSDDEQLFFAGLMPYYVAKGANVQVVYFTNHFDNPKRLHEQLHGLYAVGIKNYPIIGSVPDAFSNTLEGAIKNMNNKGISETDAINYEVEMLRRFKPLVVVGHDELGEYSHGQHILNTYVLKIALEKANDVTYHSDSYNKYGVWDTPKTYLHLYKENQIVMNYDEPLEYFNGKTAYEISKIGYSKHNSQQWTWFTAWLNGKNNEYTKASEIKKYSPLEFGLYKSLVGDDINKNDMFENLTLRKDEKLDKDKEEDANKENENNTALKTEKKKNFNIDKKYLIIGSSIILIIIILLIIKKHKAKNK